MANIIEYGKIIVVKDCESKGIGMKYAFVSISIIAIWFALILIVVSLEQDGLMLPLVALGMTVVLFWIGFGGKK